MIKEERKIEDDTHEVEMKDLEEEKKREELDKDEKLKKQEEN